MDRHELDFDRTSTSTPDEVEAGVGDEAMEPGVEAVGIAKSRQVPPGSDESVLDRVACELRVPEDEAGHLVQPHDGRAGELGEGVMIALRCSLDETSLVHLALGPARSGDHASSAYGVYIPLRVLGRVDADRPEDHSQRKVRAAPTRAATPHAATIPRLIARLPPAPE